MKKISLLVLVLVLSVFLKLHHYTTYPQRGSTSDEYTYSFLGLSLLRTGVPVSWSFFPYSHRTDVTIGGILFPMVYPYFDHPPLAGIIVGAWSMLWKQSTFNQVSLATIRIVPIIFSTVSALLMFFLAEKFFDLQTAWWALALYLTVPIFIISSRVVVAENLLTTVMLGTIYLYTAFKTKKTILYACVLGLLAGMGFLMKESGIVLGLYLTFMLIRDKVKPKFVFIALSAFGLCIAGYVVWGFWIDKDTFLKILSFQSARETGPQTLWYLLSTPIIINKIYQDGWYYLGFISVLFSFAKQKYSTLTPMVLFYLFFLLTTLTREGQSGWYLIPLFPFMAIATAEAIQAAIVSKSWFLFVFVLFTGMFMIQQGFEPNFGLAPVQFRVMTAILVVPILLFFMFRQEKWIAKFGKAWFYLCIFANVVLTLMYRHPA